MFLPLKRISLLLLVAALPRLVHAQTFWMQHAGGTTIDEGMDVSTDASGNTYVTGYFTTAASFGSTTLSSSGVDDVFLAKVGTNGLFTWAVKAGGVNSDRALSIKTDASGNSYITGYFYGTATFGSQTVTAVGAQDVFIAKYNSSGTCLWAKSAGGTGADIGNGITVDNSGNVIVTGEFAGTATFGSTSLTSMNGSTDVFTTKLDGSGNFLWAKKGTAPQTDRGLDVDCDASGNIYITGQFSDTITFDQVHNNNMVNAVFVVKYDPSGTEQWFRKIGGGAMNIANSIAYDNAGAVYLTGDFQGTITFFGPTNTNLGATYSNRIFIAKYDGSGGLTWAVSESSDSPLTSRSITANATNCFIAGNFKCTFDSYSDQYGPGLFNSAGYWDIFEGKYSSSGAWVMSRQLGGKQDQLCNGVSVDPSGNPHMAGSYNSPLMTPVSNQFYGYPTFAAYGMTYNNDVCSSSGVCNDPYYSAYVAAPTAGNSDIFVGDPIDPNRAPYDFYYRTGSGCAAPFVGVCINKYNGLDYDCGPDTIKSCSGVQLYAATQTSVYSPSNSIGPDFTYQWSNGGNGVFITATTTGYYSVQITSVDGCYTSEDTVYFNLLTPPAIPTISDNVVINNNASNPQPIVICADSVVLTGGNVGNNDFFWSGPQFAPGADSSLSVTIDSSGQYSFFVIDQYGCMNANSVQVELDHPLVPIDPALVCLNDTDRNDTITFCDGTPAFFFPYDSLNNPTDSLMCIDNIQTILWTISPNTNATILPYTDCQNFAYSISTAQIHQTGWYTITETIIRHSACGTDTLTGTHNYYFIVHPTPPPNNLNLTITGNTVLCPGDSAILVATGGTNYLWNTTSTNDSIVVFLPGNYSVASVDTVTNSYGCTTISTASATSVVSFTPQPVITMLPSDGVICPGDSVELVCSGTGNFVWQGPNGPISVNTNTIYATSAGTYYCVVTDPDSCQLLSNTVSIQQYNTPSIQVSPATVLCPGDTIVLALTASNGSSVSWNPPLSGSSLTQNITQPGVYSCVVQACNIATTVSVTITPTTVHAQITALTDTTICEGDSIHLSANGGPFTFDWQPINDTNQTVWVYTSGQYVLSVADTGGCMARDTFNAVFTPNLLSPPVTQDTTVCIGKPFQLLVNGTPTLIWYDLPGGNVLASGPSFQLPAMYSDTVFYILTDDGICRSQVSQIDVHMDECPTVIPNVFTPNGDGTNDTWALVEPYASEIHVEIYDRWGVLIYTYGELDGYWNGTYMHNGKPVTDGVYYYIGNVTDLSGVQHTDKGFIQLIREGPK